MKKVLKATLDDLIAVKKKHCEFSETAYKAGEWLTRATKKMLYKFYACESEISDDLECQSGISSFLFDYLAEEIVKSGLTNETLYTIIEQLGVEIVDEKWFFEGTIQRNKQTGEYAIVNGNQIHKLRAGETVSVRFSDKYWAKSAFGYNKRGKGELQGWEGYKLDGLFARVIIDNELLGVQE